MKMSRWGTIILPRKVQIILPPGSTFSLEVSNSSLVTPVDGVGGLILGWSWPVEVAGNVLNAHGQASVA
jgi:ABC-type amino acid transport system permease subunit